MTVSYVPGESHVSAKRESLGFLATIKNIHKRTGLPIAWVLFLDTIAGALITMSLTGFLLWTRLHGSRLVAGGIVLGSLAVFAYAGAGALLGGAQLHGHSRDEPNGMVPMGTLRSKAP